MAMLVVGASADFFDGGAQRVRVFGMFEGRLVEYRFTQPGNALLRRNHGAPTGTCVATVPNVAVVDPTTAARALRVFFGTTDGRLMAAQFAAGAISPTFVSFGTPPSTLVYTPPGGLSAPDSAIASIAFPRPAILAGPRGSRRLPAPLVSMFVGATNGNLYQCIIDDNAGTSVWIDHGKPGNDHIIAAPGGLLVGARGAGTQSVFVTTEEGNVFERAWNPSATPAVDWIPHGSPSGVKIMSEPIDVAADPGFTPGALRAFFSGSDSNLHELALGGIAGAGTWLAPHVQLSSGPTSFPVAGGPQAMFVAPSGTGTGSFMMMQTVVTSNPPNLPSHTRQVPEDFLMAHFGSGPVGGFGWVNEGPGAQLATPLIPRVEFLTIPRAQGYGSNGPVDPGRIFLGTSEGRLLEFNINAPVDSMWSDRSTPPAATACNAKPPVPEWRPKSYIVGPGFLEAELPFKKLLAAKAKSPRRVKRRAKRTKK